MKAVHYISMIAKVVGLPMEMAIQLSHLVPLGTTMMKYMKECMKTIYMNLQNKN